MKKALVFLVSVCIVLTFAACGETNPSSSDPAAQTAPQTLYDLIQQETAQVESGGMTGVMTVLFTEIENAQAINVVLRSTTCDPATALIDMQMNVGAETVLDMFYQGGVLYLDAYGSKLKQNAELDDLEWLPEEITEEQFKQVKPEKKGDDFVYTLQLPVEQIQQEVSKWLLELVNTGLVEVTCQSARIEFVYNVQKDELYGVTYADITGKDQQNNSYAMKMTEQVNFVKEVTVVPPSDLSAYQLVLSEADYQLMYDTLFDENGQLIENNEIGYNLMCNRYGKDTVDNFIEQVTAAF